MKISEGWHRELFGNNYNLKKICLDKIPEKNGSWNSSMRTILIRNIIVSIHLIKGIIDSVKEVKMEVKNLFEEIF